MRLEPQCSQPSSIAGVAWCCQTFLLSHFPDRSNPTMPKPKRAEDVSSQCVESEWFHAKDHFQMLKDFCSSWNGKACYYCVEAFGASCMFEWLGRMSERNEVMSDNPPHFRCNFTQCYLLLSKEEVHAAGIHGSFIRHPARCYSGRLCCWMLFWLAWLLQFCTRILRPSVASCSYWRWSCRTLSQSIIEGTEGIRRIQKVGKSKV